MQQYELTLIFKPEVTEEQADAILEPFKLDLVHRQVWGKRLFAYPIKKLKEGMYLHLVIQSAPAKIIEIERAIKLQDDIIRYLLVTAEKQI